MARPLVIAIDGPAGAGKSTVAKLVAKRLGILRLDTGAMYRAATRAVLTAGIDVDAPAAVAAVVRRLRIDFSAQGAVQIDGVAQDETTIRSPENTREVWRVADHPDCRAHLVAQQQAIVRGRDAVIEGRDATTVIAPDAQLKIYLDASPAERARRRVGEWSGGGSAPSVEDVADELAERDRRDQTRSFGALRRSDEALHLITDGMSTDGVAATIMAHAVQRHPFVLEQAVADQVIVGRSRQPGYVAVADGTAGAWRLGLTNPTPERMPGSTTTVTRNRGGRQAGTLVQGSAVLVFAGHAAEPGHLMAVPMLPQTWYVIEPGAWHACIQTHGTICAWAETTGIVEDYAPLDQPRQDELAAWLGVLVPR